MFDRAPYWGLRLWLLQFATAYGAMTLSCNLAGFPVGQVVDALLPLQLAVPVIAVASFCVLCATQESFAERSRPLWSVLSYALSPFAATFGYAAFAFLYELGPVEQSSLYAALSNAINSKLTAAGEFAARFHIPMATALSAVGHSVMPQALLAAASLAFALVSAHAALRQFKQV